MPPAGLLKYTMRDLAFAEFHHTSTRILSKTESQELDPKAKACGHSEWQTNDTPSASIAFDWSRKDRYSIVDDIFTNIVLINSKNKNVSDATHSIAMLEFTETLPWTDEADTALRNERPDLFTLH